MPEEIKRYIRECEFVLKGYPVHEHPFILPFFEAKLSNEAHLVIATCGDLDFKTLKDRLLRKFVPRQTLHGFYNELIKCQQMPEEPLHLYLERIDALHRGFVASLRVKHDSLCTEALESEIDELTSRQLTYGVKCQRLSMALSTVVTGGFAKKFEFAEDYELCSHLVRENAEWTETPSRLRIEERVEIRNSDPNSSRTVTRAVKSKRRNKAYLMTRRKCYKCGRNGHISKQCDQL